MNRRGGFLKRSARFLFGCVECLGVIAGVAALGWCAYLWVDAYLAQERGREALATIAHDDTAPSTSSPLPATPSPSRGTPLAELSIPRLGLSAVVLHGSDSQTLRLGLGHIENTPLPGESGNVAIAGHRDSFFRPLQSVRIGDDVVLATPAEQVHYRVSSFRVVPSSEISVIGPTADDTLTLVTCYPFWFIGNAPDRFVVRATRSEPAERVARSGVPATPAFNVMPPVEDSAALGGAGKNHPEADRRESLDDHTLVREAIERFRSMYNVGLARSGEASPEELNIASCDIAVMTGKATATCHGSSSAIWTFKAARLGGSWIVTFVEMG